MKTFRISLLFLLSLIAFAPTHAQTVAPEGRVVYDLKVSGKDMDPMAALMMAGSTVEMNFKGDYTRAVMKMAMMSTTAIMNSKDKKGIILMDMLGKKMAMEMTPEDFAETKSATSGMTVQKMAGTKKIAGYECSLAQVVDSTGEQYEVWYCPYLTVGQAAAAAGFGYEGIDGLPLEMDFSRDGMKMRMVAKTVTVGKQDAKLFQLTIPAGYEKTSREELEGMMK